MYMFNAANTAAAMYVGQAIGAAHLVDSFASEKLKNRFLPKLIAGDWGGTMALTEPQAGTSLGDITTSATPVEGEDYYLIRGTKRFISSGDQDITENIIHCISESGVMFILVARELNAISCQCLYWPW